MPPTGSRFWPILQKVPIKPSSRGPPYFNGLEAWRRNMDSYLNQHFGHLAPGHSGAIHLQALDTTLEECGKLVQNGTISWTTGLPTAEQLWDMVAHNRIYAFDSAHQHWYPDPQLSNYTVIGNLLPHFPGQHSLLKPEIGRRVARMHGTTKERWEMTARAFWGRSGHQGGIHLQALITTLTECGRLVREGTIISTSGLPTAEQLWDMVNNNRVYVYDPAQQHWLHQPPLSNYIVPGNIFPHFPGQRSLLKPEIGRRVARMHGTTKARWEREARAF